MRVQLFPSTSVHTLTDYGLVKGTAKFGKYSTVHGIQQTKFVFDNTLDALTDKNIYKVEFWLRCMHTYSYHGASIQITPQTVTKTANHKTIHIQAHKTIWIDMSEEVIKTEQPVIGLDVRSLNEALHSYGVLENKSYLRVLYDELS